MTDVLKTARFAATLGLVGLLGACAGQQQVAQPYDPYQSPVAVAEPVYASPPRVVYVPRPAYGPDYAYYDDFPHSAPPTLAMTVFGGGFGPVFRDREVRRSHRDRGDGHRTRHRDRNDDRADTSREERRAARDRRRSDRRDGVVPAATREGGRREGTRGERRDVSVDRSRRTAIPPLTDEQRRLRRKLWRERRTALQEARREDGGETRRERGGGGRADRRRDRAADTE